MFKNRSDLKELLDGNDIPKAALFRNLKELDIINYWLGGYNITFSALRKILTLNTNFTLVDIGSGGGDTLKRIMKWSRANNYQLQCVGIDLKPVCIEYAKANVNDDSITFICDDYQNMFAHLKKIDIIHASLFCHHFTNNELINLVRFALKNKSILVINDLERNPFAYFSIKFLTKLFSKSYLVKNDAPVSVLRGFKKKDWLDIIQQAGAKNYSVHNKWAFRHEVIIYGNQGGDI